MVIAIDPGTTESAMVIWDGVKIGEACKLYNLSMLETLELIPCSDYHVVIEQVRSYGMPVGAEVFDTVHWSGRFHQAAKADVTLMPRRDVKMHLCGTNRAKDANITQALVDRFAYGQKNKGKGTKKKPGFFYGFKSDMWAAMALAVTYYDLHVK